MKIMTSTKVISGGHDGKGVFVEVEPAKGGEKKTIKGDVILVAVGRKPYTDNLGLE
jgi:dihydrolipoamide dehydrogenase